MNCKIVLSKKRLCPCCMKEHDVKTVLAADKAIFKDKQVSYDALFTYCDVADEFFVDEQQMEKNNVAMKDSYRKSEGLLTSSEIRSIRVMCGTMYGITQDDLCALLGWDEKIISRYESYQVQNRAHDSILRKIEQNPEWFLVSLREKGYPDAPAEPEIPASVS